MRRFRSIPRSNSFTLIEMLLSMAILVILLLVITSMTQSTAKLWRRSSDQSRSYQGANRAFTDLVHNLGKATLNTYWSYFDANGVAYTSANSATFVPARYGRMSELHFVSDFTTNLLGTGNGVSTYGPGNAVFFQAPIAYSTNAAYAQTEDALNACGYFIQYGPDTSLLPAFLQPTATTRNRYRLMELLQSTENLTVYYDQTTNTDYGWFSTPSTNTAMVDARPVADNVILLLVRWVYPDSSGNLNYTYTYNSRTGPVSPATLQPITQHQLPPQAQITMIALTEASAIRAAAASGGAQPVFVTNSFSNPTNLASDLTNVESSLTAQHYDYHVFTADLYLKNSRWSTH